MYPNAHAHDAVLTAYRSSFQQSTMLKTRYVMLALIVTAADADAIALQLATSTLQFALVRLHGQSPRAPYAA